MKLVFLYGPPAAGKLTVATKLAELTGFRLFHNHLTVDLVMSLFPFDSPPFQPIVRSIRLTLLEAAAKENVPGVVFTYVYAKPNDDAFVADVCRVVEQQGGEVLFARLVCARETLNLRIVEPSRKRFGKLADPDTLASILERYACFSSVPDRESFDLDSDRDDAETNARAIARHFGLPRPR